MLLVRQLTRSILPSRRPISPRNTRVSLCSLCTAAHHADDWQRDGSRLVDGVTVVDTVHSAVNAIKVLVELPRSKWVAWSPQLAKSNHRKADPVTWKTLSAFAGEDVDFGNGPHLFIPICTGRAVDEQVCGLMKNYFQDMHCSKLWYDYALGARIVDDYGIELNGLVADLRHMLQIINNAGAITDLDMVSEAYLDKKTWRYVETLMIRNGLKPSIRGKRPWDTAGKLCIDDSWIARAAADAVLVHDLGMKLRTELESSVMHGYNSPEEYKHRVFNLYEAYSNLLGPCAKELLAIERRGIHIDRDVVQDKKHNFEAESRFLLSRFLDWATQHSPDARMMNVNSASQLRQLLFAPCQNIHVKMRSMPTSDTFILTHPEAVDSTEGATASRRRKTRKRITLIGAGKQAHVFTKAGWPAVSEKALRKVVGYPRAGNPSFGCHTDKQFCYAVDDLLRSKTLQKLSLTTPASRNDYGMQAGNRVKLAHFVDSDSGKIMCDDSMAVLHGKALKAAPGYVILSAKYKQLDMHALGILSKCDAFLDRLSSGFDFNAMGAVLVFNNARQAVVDGRCIVEEMGIVDQDESASNIIRNCFPVEYQLMEDMDRFVVNGGNIHNLTKQMGVARGKAADMANTWYDAFEGVAHWRSACLELANEQGFIETMMGRRRRTDKLSSRTRRVRENAQSAAVRFAILGSAGEIVMAAVLKLAANETVNALGWRVVCVNADEVILEGPAYSAEIAAPFIEEDMLAPFAFELDAAMKIDLRVVATAADDETSDLYHSYRE